MNSRAFGSLAAKGGEYVITGHPMASPYHNGSAVDVAILIDVFSQLGALFCAAMLVLAIYLITRELHIIRHGAKGSVFWRLLRDVATPRVNEATQADNASPRSPLRDPARWRTRGRPRPVSKEASTVSHGVKHLAVIMDGNRRYGKQVLGSSLLGHEAGGNALMRFIKWCAEREIPMLTVYAFSTENWNRSPLEISMLMGLFRSFFNKIRAEARENGIRIRYLVSDTEKLPKDVLELMREVECETAGYNRIVVNVCVSYSGRRSLVRATERLFAARAEPTDDALRRELCRSLVDHRPVPLTAADCAVALEDGTTLDLAVDPDALLRTSREQRISNFMLYELAYTEMFFVDELWPAVSEATIDAVLDTFAEKRDRRFGR
jgi:undecaprenyl diphosphate synthase